MEGYASCFLKILLVGSAVPSTKHDHPSFIRGTNSPTKANRRETHLCLKIDFRKFKQNVYRKFYPLVAQLQHLLQSVPTFYLLFWSIELCEYVCAYTLHIYELYACIYTYVCISTFYKYLHMYTHTHRYIRIQVQIHIQVLIHIKTWLYSHTDPLRVYFQKGAV